MITKYTFDQQNTLVEASENSASICWIDILNPTAKERQTLKAENNIILPLHHELYQLEFSNRFYEENNALYLSIHVITKASPIPESHIVTLILSKTILVTVRYSDPNPIHDFITELKQRHIAGKNHFDIFMLLLDKFIGRVADIFELIGEETDILGAKLIGSIDNTKHADHAESLNVTLRNINYLQILISKAYQALSSLNLLTAYVHESQKTFFSETWQTGFDIIVQDISSLHNHGEYLTQKLGFQLQSTLGLINIEQTHIVKIFTILAMIFMPPTLIASIYGMNFQNMPELHSQYAYPVILILMTLSALVPYLFFKRKKWI